VAIPRPEASTSSWGQLPQTCFLHTAGSGLRSSPATGGSICQKIPTLSIKVLRKTFEGFLGYKRSHFLRWLPAPGTEALLAHRLSPTTTWRDRLPVCESSWGHICIAQLRDRPFDPGEILEAQQSSFQGTPSVARFGCQVIRGLYGQRSTNFPALPARDLRLRFARGESPALVAQAPIVLRCRSYAFNRPRDYTNRSRRFTSTPVHRHSS